MPHKITLAAALAALLLVTTLGATPATAATTETTTSTVGMWSGWIGPHQTGPRLIYGPSGGFCASILVPITSAANPPDSGFTVWLYWVPGCPSWARLAATLHPGDYEPIVLPPAVAYRTL